MQRIGMAKCCAVHILAEFGNTSTAVDRSKYTKQQVSDFIDTQLNDTYANDGIALLQINLNGDQYELFGQLLQDKGFKLVIDGAYNPGHDTRIYVLIKQLHSQ